MALLAIVGLMAAVGIALREFGLPRDTQQIGVLVCVWAPLLGTIVFYVYCALVARAAGNRGTAVSCWLVVALFVIGLGLTIYGMPRALAMPIVSVVSWYDVQRLVSLPFIGFGSLASVYESIAYVQFGFSSMATTGQILLAGAPWWCAITLVQLALMPGRPPVDEK